MKNKNLSVENLFYIFPKTSSNNSTKTDFLSTSKNNFFKISNSRLYARGSSTFDYLNDINKDKYKYPKIKPPFLTKSKRSIKIHKNILDKLKKRKKMFNALHKPIFKLSDSCEFFYNLNKTYLTDKNSLKKTNTMNLLFKEKENKDEEIKTSYKTIFMNTTSNNKTKKIINLKIKKIDKKGLQNNKTDTKKMNQTNINFLYNKIFPKLFVDHNANYNVIDNKLNLLYAKDERHFNNKLYIKNKILLKEGKKLRKMVLDQHDAIDKLEEIKKKIGFIKGVTDYSYPDIILQKSKLKYDIINLKKKKVKKFKLPYQIFEEEKNRDKLNLAKSLSETIIINMRRKILTFFFMNKTFLPLQETGNYIWNLQVLYKNLPVPKEALPVYFVKI